MGLSLPHLRRLFHGGNIIAVVMIKTYVTDIRQFEKEAVYGGMLEAVSPYRRQKIDSLRHEKDKMRSLGAAVSLNRALREYGLQEKTMRYDLGEHGKPCFRDYPELFFSISHSGEYAVCSIGSGEIGNDIEQVRSGKERVAERFFAPEELAWIRKADSVKERDERIFRIWTMKESFLKVTGLGMSLPLQSFAFCVEENGQILLRQSFDEKTYFLKEYLIKEEACGYKISVCSESPEFAPDIIPVLLPD